jgi:hypothetical protein
MLAPSYGRHRQLYIIRTGIQPDLTSPHNPQERSLGANDYSGDNWRIFDEFQTE